MQQSIYDSAQPSKIVVREYGTTTTDHLLTTPFTVTKDDAASAVRSPFVEKILQCSLQVSLGKLRRVCRWEAKAGVPTRTPGGVDVISKDGGQ